METLTILVALAAVAIPALTEAAVARHSPARGNGRRRAAHIPQKSLAHKSLRTGGVCL
jgi:hypothetical protein